MIGDVSDLAHRVDLLPGSYCVSLLAQGHLRCILPEVTVANITYYLFYGH
jgi:hypothetical protein